MSDELLRIDRMMTQDEHVTACTAAAHRFFEALTAAQEAEVSLAFILPGVLEAMRANGVAVDASELPLIGGLLG